MRACAVVGALLASVPTATWASDGCDAVNAGGLNFAIPGSTQMANLVISGKQFSEGDRLTARVQTFDGSLTAAYLIFFNGSMRQTSVNFPTNFQTFSVVAAGNESTVSSYIYTSGIQGNHNVNQIAVTCVPGPPNDSTTSVQSSLPTSIVGQQVTFTATVPGPVGTATGTITFNFGDGTSTQAVALSGGTATVNHTFTLAGPLTVTASYGGDANYRSSSGTVSQTVNKTGSSVSLGSAPSPSVAGQSVAFTATVSSAVNIPTGTVTINFGDGSATSNATLSGGVATIHHSYAAAANYTATVTYNGDNNYLTSQSAATQTVNQAPSATSVVSSANPSIFGQSVILTATVTGASPTGTVQFKDGAANLGSPITLSSGQAALTTSALSTASHSITAVYSGDTNNLTSTSPLLTQSVQQSPTTTTVVSSVSPVTAGQSVTFTATVTGVSPTGTVQFKDGAANLGSPVTLSGGQAVLTTSALTVGGHSITAVYSGDTNNITSTSVISQTVNQSTTSTTVVSSSNPGTFGQPVTFTATVTGVSPTGTVQFKDGATNLGSPVALTGGQAALTTSALTVDEHSITAIYSGDTNNVTSTSLTLAQTINQAGSSTAVISSLNPATFGQSVTFTATVTGVSPTGTVQFKDGVSNLGSPVTLLGGVATLSTSTLAAGGHGITAVYSGDVNNTGSTSAALAQAVDQAGTTTALTSSRNPSEVGQSVTFAATVTSGGGSPSGTVNFLDGGTLIGSAALGGGIATLTTTSLTLGSHSVTAVYAGNASFTTSTSPPLLQAVNTPADSLKLRAMQVLAAPMAAQASGQAISGAIDTALSEGFSEGGSFVTPNAGGLRFNFAADPDDAPARTSPDGAQGFATDRRGASARRVDDAFAALDRRGPTKAPRFVEQRDWLGWAEVKGATLDRWNTSSGIGIPSGTSTLYGTQVNVLAGLTRRVTPNFLVGVLGGYETFDYRSDALQGRLKGDGWTVGSYLGWKLAPNLRFDAAVAYSGIGYDGTAGAAAGSFGGQRWMLSSGLTGTHQAWGLQVEPSARIYALWERENAYVDTLGTLQAQRNFSTGRASGGVKISYPFAWTSTVALSPYFGLYGDYYFNTDDAAAATAITAIQASTLLDGWSARAAGGFAAKFSNGALIAAGGERGGIGSNFATWTYRARASIPFGAR